MAVPAKDKVHLAAVQKFEDIACINKDIIFPASQRNRDKVVVNGKDLEILTGKSFFNPAIVFPAHVAFVNVRLRRVSPDNCNIPEIL